jgi:periplasmic mercuric ion binding protein
MSRSFGLILFGFGLLLSAPSLAAERTLTLAVQNMYCANCPFVVQKSLEAVPGVVNVTVSYKDKTATVTFDDSKVDSHALTAATKNAGYPSTPKG